MYICGGMIYFLLDICIDMFVVLDWFFDVVGDEVVFCLGGWLKIINSFSFMFGWNFSVGLVMISKGWMMVFKVILGIKKGFEV